MMTEIKVVIGMVGTPIAVLSNSRTFVKLDDQRSALSQAKQQLLDLYCNKCDVKSSQLEDPSNEGRVYTVEI